MAKRKKRVLKKIAKPTKRLTKKIKRISERVPTGVKNFDLLIEKGFEIANIIYSLHLTKTIDFIEKMVLSLGGEISYYKKYVFPIKWSYEFHKKKKVNYDVTLLRIITNR